MQAYQKRAPFVIDYLVDLARKTGRRMPMRLVKGAYWDSEIKKAQVDGLAGYPVFTRKPNTDVSYLACARRMLAATRRAVPDVRHPQRADDRRDPPDDAEGRAYEYQRLHGMGDHLYAEVIGKQHLDVPCRVYAPVGSHEDLLPYLVRRLLENGANSSFVNRITDETPAAGRTGRRPGRDRGRLSPASRIRTSPRRTPSSATERKNSMGVNLANDENPEPRWPPTSMPR